MTSLHTKYEYFSADKLLRNILFHEDVIYCDIGQEIGPVD